jgi:hypothetical protein
LPRSTLDRFCDQYEKLIRDFWWGDNQNKRKVHWTAWDNLTKPKGKED